MKNNILIVGCGKIAATHAKNLKAAGAQLSFYSREAARAQSFAKRFGGRAFYGDLTQAIDAATPDAVWVCTPPLNHLATIEVCLAKEIKVFCEKPLVTSAGDLRKLSQSSLSESLIMVGENYLYRPMLTWLAAMRENHNLGVPVEISVRKESYQKVTDWRRDESALIEGGIHFVALILEVLNYPPMNRVAIEASHHQKAFVVEAQTDGGAKIRLLYSWTNRYSLPAGLFQSSWIRFERGEVRFESNGLYATLHAKDGSVLARRGFISDLGGFAAMTQDALEWIAGRTPAPKSSFTKAVAALNFVGVGP